MHKVRRSGVVSVVLVNFRGVKDTLQCIEELRKLDWPRERLELIVVENGSGDGSLEQLKLLGDEITLIDARANLGFTGGCNLGVSRSTGEFVAFLNNDAKPDSQWITTAMETFAGGNDIGAVASKVLDWDGVNVDYIDAAITWFGMGYKPHAGERDRGQWDVEKDVLFGTGAAMFVRANVFEELGGFDDNYFMFYDDVDLGWRLNLLGYRFRFQPKSLAFHKHHASMNKFGDFREMYLLERNALLTLYKNLGSNELQRVLPGALLLTIRRAVARGQIDSTSLDVRAPGDDSDLSALIPKVTVAGVFAVDQFVDMLPQIAEARSQVQATRVRADRELSHLFGEKDQPAYPIESYLRGYEKIVDVFDILQAVPRRRVLIVTGDPIGAKMAGPAIRAWNIALHLAEEHEVRLLSMTKAGFVNAPFEVGLISHQDPESIVPHEQWADVIVVQGHGLLLFPALEKTTKVLVVDVYDPLHLEQLEQGRHKPLHAWDKQVNDATGALNHQLLLGDFFLCASERQRHFWLGQLAALGRVNVHTYSRDNDLESLIATTPFGISANAPLKTRAAIRGVVPGISDSDKVIIWGGGIYSWFDPETLIRAVAVLARKRSNVRLFFLGVKHPHPDVPEMEVVTRARELADSLGINQSNVFFNENWVEYDDRQNYLLEADVGVSTHFQHVETTFSFRTRILDYLWAGLPIVTTGGDSLGDLVETENLGISVQERDVDALVDALDRMLYDEKAREDAVANVARVRERFVWASVLAPLLAFCRSPLHAADKQAGRYQPIVSNVEPFVKRPRRPTGVMRDLERVVYYLRNGGLPAVLERMRARHRRLKERRGS
jgi:hypothetical protein